VRAVDRAVVCERMQVDIAIMQALGFALALSPLSGVLVLLSITIRRQWRQSPLVAPLEPLRPSARTTALGSGVREPRRPFVPSDVGSVAFPLSPGSAMWPPRPTDRAEARADRIEVLAR